MLCISPIFANFVTEDAIDHCRTTRSILGNETHKAGISPAWLIIPADGETVNL